MTYNDRPAQELAKWADSGLDGMRLHLAIYQACFVDYKNIGKADNLLSLVKQAGLSEQEACKILNEKVMKEAVDDDWLSSKKAGITSVPTFMVGKNRLLGAQSYTDLSKFVESIGWEKTS